MVDNPNLNTQINLDLSINPWDKASFSFILILIFSIPPKLINFGSTSSIKILSTKLTLYSLSSFKSSNLKWFWLTCTYTLFFKNILLMGRLHTVSIIWFFDSISVILHNVSWYFVLSSEELNFIKINSFFDNASPDIFIFNFFIWLVL